MLHLTLRLPNVLSAIDLFLFQNPKPKVEFDVVWSCWIIFIVVKKGKSIDEINFC